MDDALLKHVRVALIIVVLIVFSNRPSLPSQCCLLASQFCIRHARNLNSGRRHDVRSITPRKSSRCKPSNSTQVRKGLRFLLEGLRPAPRTQCDPGSRSCSTATACRRSRIASTCNAKNHTYGLIRMKFLHFSARRPASLHWHFGAIQTTKELTTLHSAQCSVRKTTHYYT